MLAKPRLLPLRSTTRKVLTVMGHLASWLLIGMSVWLYQERLNLDAAYYVFKVVNKEWFHVEHNRLVLALGEFLPVIAVKLGADLKTVLQAYSLNPPLYFYGFFLLFSIHYKRVGLALSIVLMQLVGLTHGYFNPIFELYYLVPLVLWIFLLLTQEANWPKLFLVYILTWLIVTGHLSGLILLVFVLGLDFIDNGEKRPRYWLSVAVATVLALVWTQLNFSGAEVTKLAYYFNFSENKSYLNLVDISYLKNLVKYMLLHYWELMLLLVTAGIAMMLSGRWKQLLWSVIFFVCVLIMIQVIDNGLKLGPHPQQVYFPLVAIGCTVFGLYMHAPYKLWRRAMPVVFLIVLVARFDLLLQVADGYQGEVDEIHAVTNHARCKGATKATSRYRNLVHDDLVAGHWSYPIQTLLISSLKGPEHSVTVHWDTHVASANPAQHEFVFRMEEVFPVSSLNTKYFKLDSKPYMPLQKDMADEQVEVDSWDKLQIQLMVDESNISLPAGRKLSLPLVLRTEVEDTVYADANNELFFSYHWYKGDELITWDGLRTAIEVDVNYRYKQRLMIRTPNEPGIYRLELDIVHENVGWKELGISYRIPIH